jgi:hypothetical protein
MGDETLLGVQGVAGGDGTALLGGARVDGMLLVPVGWVGTGACIVVVWDMFSVTTCSCKDDLKAESRLAGQDSDWEAIWMRKAQVGIPAWNLLVLSSARLLLGTRVPEFRVAKRL